MVAPEASHSAGRQPGRLSIIHRNLGFEIDAWDLAELRKNDPSVVVIDTRSREAFTADHIPGAVSFLHRQLTPASPADLNPQKTYITYCDGIGCNASTKGALKLAELGFRTCELLGGLDWWKRNGYPTEGEVPISARLAGRGCP